MPKNPEAAEFERKILLLEDHRILKSHFTGDKIMFSRLTLEEIDELCRDEVTYYFLISAAGLNRTSIKKAAKSAEAQIVQPQLRRAFVIKEQLPIEAPLSATFQKAVAMRTSYLARMRRGRVEGLLRDRLEAEGIPIFMSPPIRQVPGLLIDRRKPDGVYPDPATGKAPKVYLEIKGIRRVSDDIQKRLYEIAETSIEMKAIYGDLKLHGLNVTSVKEVARNADLRERLRLQIVNAKPTLVAFLICPKAEAEKYRSGAETFIDRVFFQEEVDECIAFLRGAIAEADA